jgi:amino acid transporter
MPAVKSGGSERNLERRLGLLPLLAVSVGGIIGSAWLFAPLYAAQMAGPAAIFAWVIAAGVALILALVYAELGAAFPVAGGLARFSYFSHGNIPGFVAGISCWLGYVAIAPIEVQAMVRYMADAWPWLMTADGSGTFSSWGVIVAAALLLLMSAVNLMGVRWFGESNKWITLWKVLVPVSIPIALMTVSFERGNFFEQGGFFPQGWAGVFSAVATGGVMFAMLGFRAAIEMAGEAKNPQRDLPLATIGSVLITGTIYLLIQIGFLGALPAESLAHGWSHLASHVAVGPFVELATAAGLIWLVRIIYIDSVVSPGGSGLVFCAASARLPYAMARNGQLPGFLELLNRKGVPHIAVGVNFLVGLIFLAPSQTWQTIVSFISSIQILSLAFGPLALVALRRSAPHVKRPFRLPGADSICLLAFFAANTIVYWCGWETNRVSLGLVAGGALIFIIAKKWSAPHVSLDLVGITWLIPYGAGLATISALGNFGGGSGVIPAGYDIGVLALFSLAILVLSLHSPNAQLPDEFKKATET